jgi:hypothetical protein
MKMFFFKKNTVNFIRPETKRANYEQVESTLTGVEGPNSFLVAKEWEDL